MSTLNGEVIEKLLWENGLDFFHYQNPQGIPGIEIYSAEGNIFVTETFVEDDDWFIDAEYLTIDRWYPHEEAHIGQPYDVENEEELMEIILKYLN